jgi:Sec-independent protein translocase protein TatA
MIKKPNWRKEFIAHLISEGFIPSLYNLIKELQKHKDKLDNDDFEWYCKGYNDVLYECWKIYLNKNKVEQEFTFNREKLKELLKDTQKIILNYRNEVNKYKKKLILTLKLRERRASLHQEMIKEIEKAIRNNAASKESILQIVDSYKKKYSNFIATISSIKYYKTGKDTGIIFSACKESKEIEQFYRYLALHNTMIEQRLGGIFLKKRGGKIRRTINTIIDVRDAFHKRYYKYRKIQKDISSKERYEKNSSLIKRLVNKHNVDRAIINKINTKGGGAYNTAVEYTKNQFKNIPRAQIAKMIKTDLVTLYS